MATFVLLPGAGSDSWYWHLVVPDLEEAGHDVVTVDLPVTDDTAGFAEYTDVVVDAIGDRPGDEADLVLVAQSLAGFTAPLVCERVPVELMILVAAMVPRPGESGGEWWEHTGYAAALQESGRGPDVSDDPVEIFLHDVPADVAAESEHHVFPQSEKPFEAPWPLDAWPDVPTRFLLCRDDRFFPAEFQRRVVRERLGIEPDEMDSGHLPALSRPHELAQRLLAYLAEVERAPQ
ncbi:MAG TPA: alpha/beta hydrolase [Acidimicrobiia bacterium]|jgi:pimeloyl-ACP methyl ester carboxylesterase